MTDTPHAGRNTLPVYEEIADWFDTERGKTLFERQWLDRMLSLLQPKSAVLDLGCGSGEPIARYLKDRDCAVTGVDGAARMIELCRDRFPDGDWICADMRSLDLGRTFDAIVAWDSFFHLTRDEQRAMFPRLRAHTGPGSVLMFTTGPADSEAWSQMAGHDMHHASLAPDEYRSLLADADFDVVHHVANDPDCGGHTVWLAQRGK